MSMTLVAKLNASSQNRDRRWKGLYIIADKEVAFCKETLAMWAKLGMDYRKIKCNCVW